MTETEPQPGRPDTPPADTASPDTTPGGMSLGLVVAQTAKALDRALDDALVLGGGNRPTWLILMGVKSGAGTVQSSLAEQVGISAPTLIYHLDRLETAGVVRRIRGVQNRRIQAIELTEAGDSLFLRLREAASHVDERLRTGLDDNAVTALIESLRRLSANVGSPTPSR